AGWIGNLKDAVRAQWRESFDIQVKRENFVVRLISNIVILIAMLIMIAVTFGLASVSTSLSDTVIGWLGLDDIGWLHPVFQLVPILVSIGAGWVIFMFFYLVLPETREPAKAVRRGALIGAIGLGILQYLTSFLIGTFSGNPAAALFGPVIVLMLFLNLFARLILFVAAWIGTAEHPAEPEFVTGNEGAGLTDESRSEATDAAPVTAPPIPAGARTADGRGPWSSTPGLIPEQLAARSVRAGTRVGYLVGTATGIGAGSVLARLFMRRAGTRR
ncbi:MAG TPA: YhjD/YihY/BrkB family envelope integrity protein, partial [Microlunatus sp.]